jgi:HSP20 family protein
MVTLREAMDRLFEESFVKPREGGDLAAPGQSLAVDIYEKDDALVIKAAVPGVKPDELDINITGDVLNIKGEVKEDQEIRDENYHRREFRYGAFCRSLRLPIDVDVDKADAVFKDGVLTLTLPKPEEKKPKSISVKVN